MFYPFVRRNTVGRRPFADVVVLLVAFLAVTQAFAREIPAAQPERVGLDPERLARISDYMNQAVADGTMIGGQAVIARNGRLAYSGTWGMADREAGERMTEDTIFRIYSMTKPITAVALMILYEEGAFFLNDPVAKYLPELANLQVARSTGDGGNTRIVSDGTRSVTVGEGDQDLTGQTRPAIRQPTVRDLLTHTAGFTYGKAFVSELGQLPLQYDPGTRWHYSVSVDIQGRLVEVLSGMRFGEFLQARLFSPLDMKDTSFVVPAEKLGRLAQLYTPQGTAAGTDGFRSMGRGPLVVAPASMSVGLVEADTLESGGAGLVSTARDYLRFSQMMLNGGELDGVRILSPKTVELITTNHLGDIQMGFGRSGVGFGLGFAVALDQGDIGEIGSPGEYNWGGAAGTRFWIDPQENLIGIFMVQSIPHRTRLARTFKVLTYQAIVE
jgi:CubicO group peptidase (beta-lactamase class C family)